MRRFLRWLAPTVATGFVLAIIAGVVGEFFIELARERDWYTNPSQKLDAAMNAFGSLVNQAWFLGLTAFFVGLAIGIWLDVLLRRREIRWANSAAVTSAIEPDMETRHLVLEYDPDFNHERSDKDRNRWITVRIKFRTSEIAHDARPWLYSVKRYRYGKWSDDILSGMPVILSWPGSGNRFEARRIYDEHFVLLLDYGIENRVLSFVTDKKVAPHSLSHFLDDVPAGKYWLKIGVETDNLGKCTAEFALDWFGPNEPFELLSLRHVAAGYTTPA